MENTKHTDTTDTAPQGAQTKPTLGRPRTGRTKFPTSTAFTQEALKKLHVMASDAQMSRSEWLEFMIHVQYGIHIQGKLKSEEP